MNQNDTTLSNTIKYLRFPLTVGIILAHSNLGRLGFVVHGVQYGMNYPDWYYYFNVLFSEVLACLCVPTFFVVSGYLFFYKTDFDEKVYIQKLKKRFRTLMIPYLLWNLIALLVKATKMLPIFSSIFQNMDNIEFRFSLIRLFRTFFYDDGNSGLFIDHFQIIHVTTPLPINGPMWYVRDLMVIILLTPLIYWLTKKFKYWFIIGLAIYLYLFGHLLLPEGSYLSLVIDYMFFFSWGAYYSINKQNLISEMQKLKYVAYIFIPAIFIDLFTIDTKYNTYFFLPYIIIGIISIFIITSILLEKGKLHINNTLANCSFFVFALHSLILNDLGKLLFMACQLNDTPLVLLFLYTAIPTITIVICVWLYKLLNKYLPTICGLLTGGR
jgi:surface polysaccharide O-acyltransferase-like enzyme